MKRRLGTHVLSMWVVLLSAATFSAAIAQDLIPLRVSIAPPAANRVPFIVAYEKGIYERNGLAVDQFIPADFADQMRRDGMNVNPEFVKSESEPPPLDTGNGTIIIVLPTIDATFTQDTIILATLDELTRGHIVAQPEITSLEQLKGKRLGYTAPGSRTHFIALAIADRMKWDPVQDITLLSNARMDVLLNRRVDAIIANETRLVESMNAGYKPLLDLSTWNVPIASSGVTVSRAWLQNNRETARRFMKSMVEAIALVKQDKQAALRAMEKWWGVSDRAKQEALYAGAVDMPAKPYPSVAGIRKIMQLFDSNEMRKNRPEDFYDDSFIRELDESGYIDSLY